MRSRNGRDGLAQVDRSGEQDLTQDDARDAGVPQLPQLAETAAKAIANVKFDKVVVWDSGQGGGSTANFLKGLAGSLPPMLEMMRDVGGVKMPEFLGELVAASDDAESDGDTTQLEPEPTPKQPKPAAGA